MKLKFVAAAVLALAGSAAIADVNVSFGALDNTLKFIGGNYGPATMFSDIYTFSLNDPGSVSGFAFNFAVPSFYDISMFKANLWQGATLVGSIVTPSISPVTFSGLSAGSYSLNVFGVTSGPMGGAYVGTISAVTAPVPEPETYAMMLAGLGALGFLARRRRND